jgi:hypothetical protein
VFNYHCVLLWKLWFPFLLRSNLTKTSGERVAIHPQMYCGRFKWSTQ